MKDVLELTTLTRPLCFRFRQNGSDYFRSRKKNTAYNETPTERYYHEGRSHHGRDLEHD